MKKPATSDSPFDPVFVYNRQKKYIGFVNHVV